ncbi:MAG: OmpA family protein [Cyclobacteriaceae bacterium]|nr:OmpA family protein [Cyclobacteriaceae bacterium SS2]
MKRLAVIAFLLTAGFAQAQEQGQIIRSIYFGGGSWYIDEYQIKELYHFIDSLPGSMSYSISIHSHTDNIGGVEFNQMLSEYRSQAALRVLLQKGYPEESIEIRDFGLHNPVFDNSTHEGRLKNRRVDIIFWPQVL